MSREVEVVVRKHDGSLHCRWRSRVLVDDAARLVLDLPRETEIDSARHGGYCEVFDNVVHLPRDRWWNVFVGANADGGIDHYYANVAAPPEVTPARVEYVDLELDLWILPDLTWEVLDRDEFEAAGMSDELRRRALLGLADLERAVRNREPPFGRPVSPRP